MLSGQLGVNIDHSGGWQGCQMNWVDHNFICIHWIKEAELQIMYEKKPVTCYHISWRALSHTYTPQDCIDVGDAHWYGGAEIAQQRWPIERSPMRMQEFVGADLSLQSHAYGPVLERYWLSSKGVAIYVEEDVPLHVSISKTKICFKADYRNSTYSNQAGIRPQLKYRICTKDNIKDIHLFMSKKLWKPPAAIPDINIFKKPIWSTKTKLGLLYDQQKVIDLVQEIHDHQFAASYIILDDRFTSNYGDFEFDKHRFPDPKLMFNKIYELGYKAALWITPLLNDDTKNFETAVSKKFLIKDFRGQRGLVSWWRGVGGALDFTNPEVLTWFNLVLKRLSSFQNDLQFEGYNLDTGESLLLPKNFKSHVQLANSNLYMKYYIENVFNISKTLNKQAIETRVGYRTQHLPIFVRIFERTSSWNFDRGLRSIIPTVLHLGLIGYPFVIPDLIGGNIKKWPEVQLYRRWLQLTAFLPVMQFSHTPWQYNDPDTLEVARSMVKLHQEYLSPLIIQLAEEAVITGHPIIRPIWWIAPDDSEAYLIEDQFLVGDTLLVAPMVRMFAQARDIYLPQGLWKDMLTGDVHEGGRFLRKYKVGKKDIPYFEVKHSNR